MRIVVVGGGVAGLAAAHRAAQLGADVQVIEQSPAVGGKLRTVPLPSGQPVDSGAEAFAVRDPQTGEPSPAFELARELGLDGDLVAPAVSRAAVLGPDGLEPIPAGTLMGIPGEAAAETAPYNGPLLAPGADVAVGDLVRRRLGASVVDRLVDPMLGGVYAGRADDLSLAATIPALATALAGSPTLTGAVRAVLAARPKDPTPLFKTLARGLGSLVDALAAAVGADRVHTGRPVRELCRTRDGRWRLTVGSTRDPQNLLADGVVLAVPARPAERLLANVAPIDLNLDYASVALVTAALPEAALPEYSGLLVPSGSRIHIKAVTFLDRKWPHLRRPGRTLARLSLGRFGEESVLQRPDGELVETALGDLADIVGTPRRALESSVHRWGGALPQYAPGHPARVAAARSALPPGLALAGAAYDGVGVPACVRSGRTAAEAVVAAVEESMA
ncbi:protoporphyrinogen oxidase [Virgisporangium ochraceum]|uniref:Coproporphyrinogen III oxidase n=1 Tax=Virgisporangium ochraceum TaxID=65505 RepID=A0A8J3ZY16_9ACTN|nr:protoporphyrinogen oxidase [Virgisporangium ochraceum]GIJ69560.1 protoporphyrinogen oxidase [Virgisporangium ochraceum]